MSYIIVDVWDNVAIAFNLSVAASYSIKM